jgi:endonuclease YncB( thermonuclease family)
MSLNQECVKQGWCRWYRKYAPGDTALEGLEAEAREGRKGLEADPRNPASPMNRGTSGVLVQPVLTQEPQPEA